MRPTARVPRADDDDDDFAPRSPGQPAADDDDEEDWDFTPAEDFDLEAPAGQYRLLDVPYEAHAAAKCCSSAVLPRRGRIPPCAREQRGARGPRAFRGALRRCRKTRCGSPSRNAAPALRLDYIPVDGREKPRRQAGAGIERARTTPRAAASRAAGASPFLLPQKAPLAAARRRSIRPLSPHGEAEAEAAERGRDDVVR